MTGRDRDGRDRDGPNRDGQGEGGDEGELPFPPEGFKPIGQPPDVLARYGIPETPDPRTQPKLHAAWLRIFAPPLNWVPPVLEQLFVEAAEPPRFQQTRLETRIQPSDNWCGALIVPHGGLQFVQVFGEWAVPTPKLPRPFDQAQAGNKHVYQSSTWIGLDGDRLYLNSSLPQVGTAQELAVAANGTEAPEYYAWFQWWARDQTALRFKKLKNVQIQAGTDVMGLIWAIDPTHVHVVFRNFAPLNQITIFRRRSPDIQVPPNPIVQPTISGATAEWIMERPTKRKLNATKLDLFPGFSPVHFKHCVAGMARVASHHPPTAEQSLTAPRYKWMFEMANDAPSRTRIIAMSERMSTDTTAFKVHHGGFKPPYE
jgi:Peptidase A4 family